jgi:predicted transcriptional regulator of viral defense system
VFLRQPDFYVSNQPYQLKAVFYAMESKNISYRSSALLSHFHQKSKDFFSKKEAIEALAPASEGAVGQLLSDMVRRGLLLRLKSGLYHIIPYEEDPATWFPNWHLVADRLAEGMEYYLGYNTALQIHGLTTQPYYVEQIVVSRQMRPARTTVKDVEFQFIFHNAQHFFGFEKTWIDDYHRLPVSTLEKTLIDCLYKPDYAGGIVEVAKAVFQARDTLDFERLMEGLKRFGVKAAAKRLGLLLEVFNIRPDFAKQLQPMLSNAYALLDPSLPPEGKYSSKWKLQINLDLETISSSVYT